MRKGAGRGQEYPGVKAAVHGDKEEGGAAGKRKSYGESEIPKTGGGISLADSRNNIICGRNEGSSSLWGDMSPERQGLTTCSGVITLNRRGGKKGRGCVTEIFPSKQQDMKMKNGHRDQAGLRDNREKPKWRYEIAIRPGDVSPRGKGG